MRMLLTRTSYVRRRDVTGRRQQEGRRASHVSGGGGRAHGELCGTGTVRPDAGGAGRQPVPSLLHCEQVRGPGGGRRGRSGTVRVLGAPSIPTHRPVTCTAGPGLSLSVQSRGTSGL